MKKLLVVLGIICVVVVIFIIGINRINHQLDQLKDIELAQIQPGTYPDGAYEGFYQAFPITVRVRVTIAEGVITSIEILEHQNGKGEAAEPIVDQVVAAQSLEVDTIAGATYSSMVILLAISDALSD
jgi:uncharacterized protein with FMN-binding domain